MYTCAFCHLESCEEENPEKYPDNCPCLEERGIGAAKAFYDEFDNKEIAHAAAVVEASGYCKLTRLEEIMAFAKKMGYQKLGIAFCIGLKKETQILSQILKHNGFQVDSVACKNSHIPKEFIGVIEEEKIEPGTYETMCNPIGQALFLNKAGTELNLIMGLCVGHDTLFIRYSKAPVTVFAAKDRVLGHYPMAAIYLADSYYKNKLFTEK